MTVLIWIFLVFFIGISKGCYFEGNDPDGFYTQLPRVSGRSASVAGPFDIRNAVSKANNSHSYNHYSQGNDWPNKFKTCAGYKQSPIAFTKRNTIKNCLCNPPLKFVGYGRLHPHMKMVNNGHTIDNLGPWGENGNDVPTMSGGPLKGSYILHSYHFHWGHNDRNGAEHTINGHRLASEMHLVHYSAEYKSIAEATAANKPDSLAVIGFLFQSSRGFKSSDVREMFKTLDMAFHGIAIDPPVFPINLVNYINSYYSYDGSLTTPDCNEIVKWIVVSNPIFKVSSSELAIFRKYMKNGKPMKGVYRNIQKLNNRKVYKSSNQKRCVEWKIKYLPIFVLLMGSIVNP